MPKQLPLFSHWGMQVTESLPEEAKEKAICELKNLFIEYIKKRTIKEKGNER
jgi:hypothetical protein